MAEPKVIVFDYKEVVTALLKQENIHTGLWALYIEFGLGAVNMPIQLAQDGQQSVINPESPRDHLKPVAMIAVQQIGLVRTEEETNISVDAAKVNPKPKSQGTVITPRRKASK